MNYPILHIQKQKSTYKMMAYQWTFCYLQSLHIPLLGLVKSLKLILCTIYYFNISYEFFFRELIGTVCFCTKIVSVTGCGLPMAFPREKHHQVFYTPKESDTLNVIAPLHFNRIKYFIEISSCSKCLLWAIPFVCYESIQQKKKNGRTKIKRMSCFLLSRTQPIIREQELSFPQY